MLAMEIQEQARRMMEVHGPKAIAEAAQKARESEERGEKQSAENWRRIEAALLALRGPNST